MKFKEITEVKRFVEENSSLLASGKIFIAQQAISQKLKYSDKYITRALRECMPVAKLNISATAYGCNDKFKKKFLDLDGDPDHNQDQISCSFCHC